MTDEGNDRYQLINAAIKASIEFEDFMDKTDFDSWLDGVYLFCWDEIPGNDDEILKKILKENFEIKWVESAEIEKNKDDTTIRVSTKENFLSLRLNDDKSKVKLETDDGSVYEFTVETKGDKLNICFTDSSETLKCLGQSDGPFIKYKKNKKELKDICDRIKRDVINNSSNSVVNSSLERYPISKLFKAKLKRLEARICSDKEDEEKEYNKALSILLSALNDLQNLEIDNNDKRWLILFYNDLSICYAGLDNSSMSRGYAEDVKKLIEKEKSYKEFEKKWSANNSKNLKDIEGIDFVSSKLYDLYTVALFNQAEAERRSHQYTEAERNFKRIINYGEKNICLINFNHYSAILYLSLLYIDQGRGKEAIGLLEKVINKSNEADIRYLKAFIAKSQALIDQSEYDEAKGLLFNKFLEEENKYLFSWGEIPGNGNGRLIEFLKENFEMEWVKTAKIEKIEDGKTIRVSTEKNSLSLRLNDEKTKVNLKIDDVRIDEFIANTENGKLNICEYSYVLNKEHKVTSQGFKALNYFTSCQIEKVRNTLKITNPDKAGQLNKVKNLMEEKIINFKKRKQKGFETKAYKHLSEIYTLLKKDTIAMKYFIKYLSNGDIDELKNFVSHPKMEDWIDECNDLDFLERFIEEICKFLTRNGRYLNKMDSRKILKKLKEKIKKECDDKGQLSRAERMATKIEEVLGGGTRIKYPKDTFDEIFRNDEKGFTLEDIRTRLDINEKEFDSVLFTRSNIKNDNHIVELIVLRRWNSFSPGLFRESTGSLGGGYLLRINKDLMEGNDGVEKEENESVENIVIDPGYNFLQNFRSEGFCIEDIDTIIVTHSHLDHCAELLPIMDLIFQINKRYKNYKKKERQKKRVNLCLSQGTYKKFSSYTNDPDWQKQLKDVIILEDLPEKKWIPFEGLTISAIQTHHMDLGGVNAIGLIIEIDGTVGENEENSETVRLGFTGDTPWYPEIKDNFDGCDLLCVHLGSIKYQEIGYTDDRYNLKSEPRKISKYLFSWGNIPGEDNEKLLEFLRDDLDVGWVENAEISKSNDDKTIHISKNGNSAEIIIDEEEKKATLKIGDRTFDLKVKRENDKLNICSSEIEQRKEFDKTYATANHLLFFGTLEVIESCANKDEPLIIVGEFGEELKYGLRTDLCKKLYRGANKQRKNPDINCLPCDSGLYIGIEKDGTKKVRCNFCESFVRPKEIKTFSYGREDAIQYICQTCEKSLSVIQKHAIIKHRLTRH